MAVDLFQEAVNAAVQKTLSDTLNKMVSQVIRKELPHVIQRELPHVLEKTFRKLIADHSPSRGSSPAPRCTQTPGEPTDDASRPNNHCMLGKMVKGAYGTVVREALDEAHEQSTEIYNAASIDLEEYGTEIRSDLALTAEDHLADCNERLNVMVASAEERLSEYLTELEEESDDVVMRAGDRLRTIGETISKQLFCSRKDDMIPKRGQRATSLPVSKDDNEQITYRT